jgi:hypothetical protein
VSRADDGDRRRRGAPSNAELAERTARLEQKIDHISDSVDRIEGKLIEEHEELTERVDDTERKADRFWTIYRFILYLIPLVLGTGGAASYWLLL